MIPPKPADGGLKIQAPATRTGKVKQQEIDSTWFWKW
jgi:hypothetical protein